MAALPSAVPDTTQDVRMHAPAGAGWTRVAEEVAIAFTCRGVTHAVLMATPQCLEDFALGFCLTERVITRPDELRGIEVVPRPQGIELQLDLADSRVEALWARHRRMAGPVGCGLCGVESLAAAMRPAPAVHAMARLAGREIHDALAALARAQDLHRQTHGMHAAGFWCSGEGLVALREDVGRHNALDKLIGGLSASGRNAGTGAVLLTSRVSVDLVQKAATAGCAILVAISAPTALAVRVAEACGITLVAGARQHGYGVFTHPGRIAG